MKYNVKIIALLTGVALLITVVAIASFWAFGQIEASSEARRHTNEVLGRADGLLTSLVNAETGERGYLLTGDPQFLQPYLSVRDSINDQLMVLSRLITIDSARVHIMAVPRLVELKMAEMSRLIDYRRFNKVAIAAAMVKRGEGMRLMDSIRNEIASVDAVESAVLAEHEREFQANMTQLFTVIIAAGLLMLLFAFALAYLMYRETRHKLKQLVHNETVNLLHAQEETNKKLQWANFNLQISEEKFEVTLNSIGDAVIATDAEGCVTILNPLAEHLTGWSQQQAFGRPIEEIFHIINQETRKPSVIPIKQVLEFGTKQGLANHTVLISRTLDECAIADSCAPIIDRDGKVVGAVLVFRDVTKEYEVQKSLRESEDRSNKIFEESSIGVLTLSEDLHFVRTNIAFQQMLGYSHAELCAKTIMDVTHPEHVSKDIEHIKNLLAGTIQVYETEKRYIRKDGELTWGNVKVTLHKNEKGEFEYFLVMVEDINERKLTEDKLLKAGPLQNAIFNSANFSSIATDANGVIQIFNVGAERMLGYSAADVMNKITPADISDPQEVIIRAKALSVELSTTITPGFEALVFKASRGIEDIYELTYIRKDGSRFPAVVSVTALRDEQNTIIGYLLIGTDNTARKQAEEALLKAGALQSAIFNSANFSSIATDAKGVIQIFNVGAERMLGYSAADVMNKITPADISDPQEVIVRAKALSVELSTEITPGFEALVFKAKRGIEDIYELTYIRKDGSRFPAVVSVTALRDEQNTIIGYLLIGTDNTARKHAEEALLKAGALQSAIFNSANFSSIATDANGVIQIFNVGAERMLGYKAADVMNKITPADISDPQEVITRAKALSVELSTEIAPGFEALVFKAKRGIEDIYELTYIRKDGSRFPAVVSVTALRDEQNTIIGYLLIGTDNTARKQIEAEQKVLAQKLRDHQFYTRSLFEANIDALMTTDPSGIITDVNKQMEVLTDSTRDELIGAPFKRYFTDPELAQASIDQVLNEKKLTNYELTARTRDGKETVVSYNATTFYDRDRKLQGVFAAARDITERKQLDQALLEKNIELEKSKSVSEKANLAKSNFLSSMSHELRSPLNAILGFAQLMQTAVPLPTNSQKESITQILQAGWHLLKLINEVLDLAVVESGKVSLSQEPVSLGEVISECEAMFVPEGHKRNIKMIFPEFYNPMFVLADRTRLKQIFINLLSNAIKYNRDHGVVEVKCTASTPDHILISVKDTGPGMTPDQVKNLFQPFNRLGQENSSIEGTGIGLSTCKRLVELMGGLIGVQSNVGTGSVFWFEMTSADAVQIEGEKTELISPSPAAAPKDGRLSTLLYVEDNPANMKLVEELVARRSDIHLLRADNGNLGIELAVKHLPDVILMDINLPGINGIQALKLLRENSTTMHIPVVALSANAMPLDIKNGLEAGFFRYLTKPIKVNEFMNTLNEALSSTGNGQPQLQPADESEEQ
ncbi:MAG: PAS domain S-box protein [Bacteroidetes bacterium]|nr:PAS domain S-box protein [Bacteroidota bacterium]